MNQYIHTYLKNKGYKLEELNFFDYLKVQGVWDFDEFCWKPKNIVPDIMFLQCVISVYFNSHRLLSPE